MTYEYMCTDCGHAWEAEQPISEAPLRTCPKCQHDTAKRQVSGGEGSGDSGGGSKSEAGTSSSSSSTPSSGGSSDKGSAATPAA